MDEDLAFLIMICTVIVLIALCCLGGCHETELTKREAMKAGMVQKQEYSGSSTTTVWTKP